jgi:hypothetical protein
VGVSDNYGINVVRVDWEGIPISLGYRFHALEEAAINQYFGAQTGDEKTASSYGVSCAEE